MAAASEWRRDGRGGDNQVIFCNDLTGVVHSAVSSQNLNEEQPGVSPVNIRAFHFLSRLTSRPAFS